MLSSLPDKPGKGFSIFTDEDLGKRHLTNAGSAAAKCSLVPVSADELLKLVNDFEKIGLAHVAIDAAKRTEVVSIADFRAALEEFLDH